jgi:hypothetical protein
MRGPVRSRVSASGGNHADVVWYDFPVHTFFIFPMIRPDQAIHDENEDSPVNPGIAVGGSLHDQRVQNSRFLPEKKSSISDS